MSIRVMIALFGFLVSAGTAQADRLELSLEQARQLAEERSPSILAAEEAVAAAQASVAEARARTLPQVSVSAGYTRLSEVPAPSVSVPNLGTVTLGESLVNSYQARGEVTYPVFTGFRLSNARAAAEWLAQAARADQQVATSEEVFSVDEAYWRLSAARAARRNVEESIRLVESLVHDVQTLRSAGMATLDDLLKVEVRLSEARLARIEARHREQVAQAALASLLGLPLDTQIAQADSPGVHCGVPSLEELRGAALESRSELVALNARMEAAGKRADVEKGGQLPNVQVFAGYLMANPNQRYFPPKDKWHGTWQAGLGISWIAWDWGIVRNRAARARAEQRKLQQHERALQDGISLQVLRQRLAVVEAAERAEIARENIRRAEEHYRTTRVAFKAGAVSSTEMLDAETTLQNARTSLSVALVDAEIAWSRLERATGEPLR